MSSVETLTRHLRPGARAVAQLLCSTAGNVLPLAAAGTLVLASLVGGGVDMALAYKAERKLQAACDAGVLAGRRAVLDDGFDEAAEDKANAFFDANFDPAEMEIDDASFVPDSNDDGETVTGTATGTLPTTIMNIFGVDDLDLEVSCSAAMGVGNSDIMFVLDNTGSMDWTPAGYHTSDPEETRIYALQQSMKSFRDTVAESTGDSNARIRYGFLPYSSSVNVGRLLAAVDEDYIADQVTVPSVRLVTWNATPIDTWAQPGFTYTTPVNGGWSHYSNTQYGNNTCGNAVPADTSWVDNGSASFVITNSVDPDTGHQIRTTGTHQPQKMTDYACRQSGNKFYIDKRTVTREKRSFAYEERESTEVTTHNAAFDDAILQDRTINVTGFTVYDDESGLFNLGTVPVAVRDSGRKTDYDNTARWAGCIAERQTTSATDFDFVSLAVGISPGAAWDLNIDMEPDSDVNTQWAPLLSVYTYARTPGLTYEAIPRDSTGIDEGDLADEMPTTNCPSAAQLLAEMDEDAFDDYVDAMTPVGSTYHDIGILWGARMFSTTGIFAENVNEDAGNGGGVSRHMIYMTDGELAPSLDTNSAYGIERLQQKITGNGSATTQWNNHRARFLALCDAVKARGIRLWVIAFGTELSDDLTQCASPDSDFEADSAEELDTHFQEIANQVGELRIVQ